MNTSVRGLLATAALLGATAVPAHAAGNEDGGNGGENDRGAASAAVLRTDLQVGLLNKSADVALNTTLNAVSTGEAAGTAEKTALTARLDGVEKGQPFSVLRADVAHAEAGREDAKTWAGVELASATVHLPGLPKLPLVELEKVTSSVECAAGEEPSAEANVLGTVSVLGKQVTLSAGGPTVVTVPEVGEVRLELSRTDTTSRTASASALDLSVSVDPLDLGVAEVSGSVTLAEATCSAPGEGTPPSSGGSGSGGTETQTGPDGSEAEPAGASGPDLAATGGGSATPYVVGGAALLLAAGGGVAFAARRGRGVKAKG